MACVFASVFVQVCRPSSAIAGGDTSSNGPPDLAPVLASRTCFDLAVERAAKDVLRSGASYETRCGSRVEALLEANTAGSERSRFHAFTVGSPPDNTSAPINARYVCRLTHGLTACTSAMRTHTHWRHSRSSPKGVLSRKDMPYLTFETHRVHPARQTSLKFIADS
jgi:hypothetical protein